MIDLSIIVGLARNLAIASREGPAAITFCRRALSHGARLQTSHSFHHAKQIMTPTDPQDPLGRLIYFTAQDIHNLAKKILQPLDITLEQFHILKYLVINDGQTQCNLCQEANKSAANMTRLLDRLEGKALLTRKVNPRDRRAALVLLTDKGREMVVEGRKILEAFAARMNQGLTAEDEVATRASLLTITANLRVMTEEDWRPPTSPATARKRAAKKKEQES